MEKYVTRRQRQELKAKKRKRIIIVIAVIAVLCLVGLIVSFVIRHSGVRLSKTNSKGSQERGEIGQIKPSGWVQQKYEGIVDSNPPYLYNRCHLIAYALTGQNANELNLITGTRYMNASTMLPWEEKVMRYLDDSDNHVLYRVTPYFKGRELLARGVEMEAYSVEDKGESLCFHVFIYNVQPGIELDYPTGENRAEK